MNNMTFHTIQGSAATAYRWGGQIYNLGIEFHEDIVYQKS